MSYRLLWSVPIGMAAGVLGVWVADLVVPGFRIDGSLTVQLLIGGVIGAISFGATTAMVILLAIPASVIMSVLAHARPAAEPAGGDADGTPAAAEAYPLFVKLWAGALHVAGIFLITPLAFFLAIRACRVVGMPVEMSGGWAAYLTVGLVASAVWTVVRGTLVPPAKRAERRRWVAARIAYLAMALVLWLAVRYIDGVHLAPTVDRSEIVDILVLAAVLCSMQLAASGKWSALTQVPLDVLAVWVLAWIGAWLANPLEFSGAGTLVLTAVAITAVTLPLWLLAPPSRSSQAETAGQSWWGRHR